MNAKLIPTYTLAQFSELLEAQPNIIAHQPSIIRGFVERWDAWGKWTDIAWLAQRFGDVPVRAGAPQFTTQKGQTICQVETTYGSYLEYVNAPDRLEELFSGQWVNGSPETLRELGLPLYSGNLMAVRHGRDPLLAQIDPFLPPPMDHLNNEIPYFWQTGNHWWLFVSLAGALTPLHQDNNSGFSFLAQLQGEKRATLYSPRDRAHYFRHDIGYMDPLAPDERLYPTWREAQPWTGTIGPGDYLLWGPNWGHHVVTLSKSVTTSVDLVNFYNLEAFSRSKEWRHELGLFARSNGRMIRSRLQDPAIHTALEEGPLHELGRLVMLFILQDALKRDRPERSKRLMKTMCSVLQAGEGAQMPTAQLATA